MDFAVDENLISDAVSRCNSSADAIEDYIDNIFDQIENLNNYWVGSSYTEFSASCEKYHPALDQLVVLLRAYAKLLDEINTPREVMEADIKNALSS